MSKIQNMMCQTICQKTSETAKEIFPKSSSNHLQTCQGLGSPACGEQWGPKLWGWGWRGLQGKARAEGPSAGSSRGQRTLGKASLRCAAVRQGRARRSAGGSCKNAIREDAAKRPQVNHTYLHAVDARMSFIREVLTYQNG